MPEIFYRKTQQNGQLKSILLMANTSSKAEEGPECELNVLIDYCIRKKVISGPNSLLDFQQPSLCYVRYRCLYLLKVSSSFIKVTPPLCGGYPPYIYSCLAASRPVSI